MNNNKISKRMNTIENNKDKTIIKRRGVGSLIYDWQNFVFLCYKIVKKQYWKLVMNAYHLCLVYFFLLRSSFLICYMKNVFQAYWFVFVTFALLSSTLKFVFQYRFALYPVFYEYKKLKPVLLDHTFGISWITI